MFSVPYWFFLFFVFFFNDTATTEIYTLSLHDALPICLDPTTQSLQVVYGCLGNDGLVHDDCGGYMPTYVGLAPGFPGLYQIDFQIPSDAATGDAVPLVIYVGSGQSNTITLAIH